MEKVKAFRDIEGVSRKDLFHVDPQIIDTTHLSHLNPRKDFGDERFQELKESIKSQGLKQPISIAQLPKSNTLVLTHGFRRMKAIQELISEGVTIDKVPTLKVPYNEENIMLEHIVLNSSKSLEPIEMAEGLFKYYKVSGSDSIQAVATATGVAYSKVHTYIKFMENASSKTLQMVRSGVMSIHNAIELTKTSIGTVDQNEKIDKGLEKMANENRDKLTSKDIGVKPPTMNKLTKFKDTLTEQYEQGKKTFTYAEVISILDNMDKRRK